MLPISVLPSTDAVMPESPSEQAPVVSAAPSDDAEAESNTIAAAQPEAKLEAEPAAAVPAMSPAACSAQLKQLFPALFTGVAKPLKLRIQADIQARAPGLFTKQLLSVVLRRYTGSHSYLVALTQATHRFDLDGAPAGELSAEHKQAAMDELTLRRTTQRDAQREAQREAQKDNQRKQQLDQRQEHQQHQERQQQQALEEQKRRNRATLLRDFENTTLTPANFSVLKGITVEAMEGYLATARQEALALRAAQPEQPRSAPFDATRQRQHQPRGDRAQGEGRSGQPPRGPRR
jgi:ProP effector